MRNDEKLPAKKDHASRKTQKQCSSGKIIYDSQGQAAKTAARLLESKGWRMKEYKCEIGKHWHLTHRDAEERRKDRRDRDRREAKKSRLEKKNK